MVSCRPHNVLWCCELYRTPAVPDISSYVLEFYSKKLKKVSVGEFYRNIPGSKLENGKIGWNGHYSRPQAPGPSIVTIPQKIVFLSENRAYGRYVAYTKTAPRQPFELSRGCASALLRFFEQNSFIRTSYAMKLRRCLLLFFKFEQINGPPKNAVGKIHGRIQILTFWYGKMPS